MDPKFLKCIYTAEAIYLKNDEAKNLFNILEEMPNIISSHSHEAKELFQNTIRNQPCVPVPEGQPIHHLWSHDQQ